MVFDTTIELSLLTFVPAWDGMSLVNSVEKVCVKLSEYMGVCK